MAITAFANNAAATAAGYKLIQTDRGASAVGDLRFFTKFEKWISGATGDDGCLLSAMGESSASQGAADTVALNSLNAQRKHHYGGAPGRSDGSANSPTSKGSSHTDDVT